MKENKEHYQNQEKFVSKELDENLIASVENQKSIESSIELSPRDIENIEEKARKEVSEVVLSAEKKSKDSEKIQSSSPKRRGSISKKHKNESYKKTIKQVQKELPLGSRIFSKITHNSFIEKTSDIAGNTIARPNAILSGAMVAFFLTLITYTIAKKYGYPLSGFETIGAFVFGWVIGIIYDYVRILITGKK